MANVIGSLCVALVLSIASGSEAAIQTLPASCTGLSNCEKARSILDSKRPTEECCGQYPGTDFHCQEVNAARALSACLTTVTCSPGHAPKLVETEGGIQLICKVCDDGYYEPKPLESYKYYVPHCSEQKQACRAEYGKVLVSLGDSTHDTSCRCLYEEGWVPYSAGGTDAKCYGREGFVLNDSCDCKKEKCPEGMQRNEDYECEATTTPMKTTEVSTTTPPPQREPRWIPEDKPFPGGLKEKDDTPREVYFYVISFVFGGVVLILPWLCCWDYIKRLVKRARGGQ